MVCGGSSVQPATILEILLSSTFHDCLRRSASIRDTVWIYEFSTISLATNMASRTPDNLADIAEILAAGLMRLAARKSSRKSGKIGESSLHFTPDQSGDAPA